ncbi:uncharacterized protein TNCV_901971 [Trichonephila clavipes]|nr:uncharacterized protein TNCV_901971 [Trichonephila clavipes]
MPPSSARDSTYGSWGIIWFRISETPAIFLDVAEMGIACLSLVSEFSLRISAQLAARATIDLLKDTFGDRLISRFGPVNWPPRFCDLTPLDYFLWGYVKSLVYAHKPQTLDHLEDNIRRVIADIRPQMLEKVIENWTSRLDYIRASRGNPMPEIIFKMRGRLDLLCTNNALYRASSPVERSLVGLIKKSSFQVVNRGSVGQCISYLITIHSYMGWEFKCIECLDESRSVRFNVQNCMMDITLKFIKRMGILPEGDIFQISPKEKSGIDKSGERGDQSPLEMTPSSKNSVKTSILSRDV